MGLFGIFAYGWLLRDRYALLKQLCGKREFMIVMAFAGMFMVSMTNPGEFCPYPNEFLMVLLFDVAQAIMVSEEAATASAESTSVVWTPARRPVPQGAYSGRVNTLSLSEGSNALVLNASYTGKRLSTASGTPGRRLGGR